MRFTIPFLLCAAVTAVDSATTQPPAIVDGAPQGAGWTKLLVGPSATAGLVCEPGFWRIDGNLFIGEVVAGKSSGRHHNCYTAAEYSDFELTCDLRLAPGKDPNSGICIRMKPQFDPGDGYQVDAGAGYWGCLYEVGGRNKKVAPVSKALEQQLVKPHDWNRFYVHAQGHHIRIWLNGTKTVDIVDTAGPLKGRLGFQMAHGRVMEVQIRDLYLRPLSSTAAATPTSTTNSATDRRR